LADQRHWSDSRRRSPRNRHQITDASFSHARNTGSITTEAALDGIYVLRTSVEPGSLDSGEVVSSYKALAQVERAFRAFSNCSRSDREGVVSCS
jgi:hypothetical protein